MLKQSHMNANHHHHHHHHGHIYHLDDSAVKNGRSSSLPLKIMINGGSPNKNGSNASSSVSCSFSPSTSASSPLSAFLAQHPNSANGKPARARKENDFRGFFINRYVQLSQSERFLNMLVLNKETDEQHRQLLKSSTSTGALFSTQLDVDDRDEADRIKSLLTDHCNLARRLAALKLRKQEEETEKAADSSEAVNRPDEASDEQIAAIASSIVELVKNEAIRRAEQEQQYSPPLSPSPSSSLSTSPVETETETTCNLYQSQEPLAKVPESELPEQVSQSETDSCCSSEETSGGGDESLLPGEMTEAPPAASEQSNNEQSAVTTSSAKSSAGEETAPESDDSCDCESLNGSTSSMDSEIRQAFRPKKSCLAKKSKLFDDDENRGDQRAEQGTSDDRSQTVSWTLGAVEPKKKSVLFADNVGKDLYTVKTMTEPSNCPPKLTSKIVQYLLHKEFSSSSSSSSLSNLANLDRSPSYTPFAKDSTFNLEPISFKSRTGSPPMSSSSSYLGYSKEFLENNNGQVAAYSLNFAQPAGDYLKFRKRLEDACVSLENVLLNRFVVNGTIKVKNINFHKQVFVRCSLDGWKTFTDYQAQYVPSDFYSSMPSSPTYLSSSPPNSFYSSAASSVSNMPQHKDYDTFRFEIELPKTADQNLMFRPRPLLNDFAYSGQSPNGSVQMCVCYRTGQGAETREFWDSNEGQNYEIIQYLLSPAPASSSSSSSSSSSRTMYKSRSNRSSSAAASSSRPSPPSSSYYSSSAFSENQISGIYY